MSSLKNEKPPRGPVTLKNEKPPQGPLPAFPVVLPLYGDCRNTGLTKREYIATQLMQGMVANGNYHDDSITIRATLLADNLISSLSLPKKALEEAYLNSLPSDTDNL